MGLLAKQLPGSSFMLPCQLPVKWRNGEVDWLWEKVCAGRQCGPPVGYLNIGSSLLSRLHACPSTFWYQFKLRNGWCSIRSSFGNKQTKKKHVWIQTTQHYCWTCLATIVLHVIFVNGASYWKVLVVQVCFASCNFIMMPVCCGVNPSTGSLASEQGQHWVLLVAEVSSRRVEILNSLPKMYKDESREVLQLWKLSRQRHSLS